MRCNFNCGDKKNSVHLAHAHKGFKVSAKLCLNLCFRKRLKPSRTRLTSFTLIGS